MSDKKKVAVLMGGWSPEREVSFMSAKPIISALQDLGYEVTAIDVTRDVPKLIADLTPKPDVVFNALHGSGGEDGVVQGILESMQIPYTHSGVTASAVAMDKLLSRKIFQSSGIPTPESLVVSFDEIKAAEPMAMPYVVKPLNEGSSVGVYIIHNQDDKDEFLREWRYGPLVLVEKFIKGREIQVAVMGDKPVGAIEIRPKTKFYDYKAKYTDGFAEHFMPAPIPEAAYSKVLALALAAHKAIDCRGVTRSDFMYDEIADLFYLLEVNTQPGMTPLSLVPEIVAHEGTTFPKLINWMIENARCDQ